MDNRAIGDKFEEYVSNLLGIRTTAKSGGHWDNADLANKHVLIECKVKHVPFFKPVKKEIQKVMNQAVKHGKEWAYIQRTDGGDFVVCSLDFFAEVTNEYFHTRS